MVTAKEVIRVMEDAYSGIGGVQVSQPSGFGYTGVGTLITASNKKKKKLRGKK